MSESREETISREDFELLQQVKKEMKDYNPLRRREKKKDHSSSIFTLYKKF
jgi:hypothetical protein